MIPPNEMEKNKRTVDIASLSVALGAFGFALPKNRFILTRTEIDHALLIDALSNVIHYDTTTSTPPRIST
jgi:hypothetical protein